MARFHATPEGNVPFTAEEEAESDAALAKWEAESADRKAAEIRQQRNENLKETDWTQLVDAPVDHAVWFAYRQALRDITAQPGFPSDINWPIKPE